MTSGQRGLLLLVRRRRHSNSLVAITPTTTTSILTILFATALLVLRPLSIHSFTPSSSPSSSRSSSSIRSDSSNNNIQSRRCFLSSGACNRRFPFANNDSSSRTVTRTFLKTPSQSLHNKSSRCSKSMEIRASSAGGLVDTMSSSSPSSSSSSSSQVTTTKTTSSSTSSSNNANIIPTFDPTNEKLKATDYANYFCAYAQLYHQKQMLTDHNRMAAYHAAIVGNANVFQDKVVMDVGTGSGILAVWAAQAGAKRVYAIEYTDMAQHARRVVKANNVDHIVTVIQSAVEDVILPQEDWDGINNNHHHHDDDNNDNSNIERGLGGLTLEEGDVEVNVNGKKNQRVVDIILSEWMGYFLLRESMLDSLVRARDTFLKPTTGLMMPSHATMLLAPICDEDERRVSHTDYANAMDDWREFADVTSTMYGVNMSVLEQDYDREQREYYVMSSRWAELRTGCLLADPIVVKELDMHICTVEDARGVGLDVGEEKGIGAPIKFDIVGRRLSSSALTDSFDPTVDYGAAGPISGFAGWFTVDFKSRTDEVGKYAAPKISNPAYLSTGPEMGYTHWGQQVFHLPSAIPLLPDQTTRIAGTLEMMRTKDSARLYNVRFRFVSSRRKTEDGGGEGTVLMTGKEEELVYQIP